MKEVTLYVPENKYSFFIELVTSLGFKQKNKAGASAKNKKVLDDLKEAVKEVNAIKAGKMKGIPAKELLHEL